VENRDLGRGSAAGKRCTLAILSDHVRNEYQNTILFGASDELREAGATVVLFAGGVLQSPDPSVAQRNALYDLVHPERIDGVIVLSPLGNHIGPAELSAYCARFAPLPVCSVSVEMPATPCVLVDDASGMRQLLEHFVVAHRKRRVAFVRGPVGNVEAQRRYHAYRDVIDSHGIAFDAGLVTIGDFDAPSGVQAVRVLCDERRMQFDALIAANDNMAVGAMQALAERRIDVPGQIAVAGFDDIEEARFTTPPLTTVRQPLYDSGRRASRILLAMLRNEPHPNRVMMETQLILRESCGCIVDEAFARHSMSEFRTVESLASFVDSRRDELVDALAHAVPAEHARIANDWTAPLLDAFLADLRDSSGTRFAGLFADTLTRAAAAGGSVRAWDVVIVALRNTSMVALGDPLGTCRADDLLHRARVLIGDVRERVQAQHRIRRERSIRTLHETSAALMTAFDEDALVSAVANQLPLLQIPACALSVYDSTDAAAPRFARALFVYDDNNRIQVEGEGEFPAHALCPAGWVDARARTLIVQPLAFRGEQLGFGVFEMGPTNGVIYEGLRELVSAAIKGARLVRQVVEEEKRTQRAERERLEKEMEIAARIQTSIVPKTICVPGLEMAATMIPAAEVGGDYYDVIPFDGGCWVGVGDVAGHGLKTGLVMLMIQSVVAALVRHNPRASPSDMVRVVNAVLFENVRRRMGQDEHATLSLLRYEGGGHFVFAGAHEEIIVHRASVGRCECIETPGPWVGAVPELGRTLVDSTVSLAPADVMVLYTDGITEAMDSHGEQLGIERVCEVVHQVANLSAQQIRDRLIDFVQRWTAKQDDDVSVIVVRRTT
jgi:phosphoserine phosphatase RsbU/P